MATFKPAVICPLCGETIVGDRVMDFTNPDGVVLLNLFELTSFNCSKCGTSVYTGDVEEFCEVEEGEIPDDDEEYDDEWDDEEDWDDEDDEDD